MILESDIKLGKNEVELRRFAYSSTDVRKNKKSEIVSSTSSVIVTTKRVILEEKSNDSLTRNELPLQSIESINTNFRYEPKSSNIGLIIISIIISLIGVVFTVISGSSYSIMFVGIGILFLVISIITMKNERKNISIDFYTKSDNTLVDFAHITSQSLVFNTKRKKTKSSTGQTINKISVIVNDEALDLVNELGALIIDAKDSLDKK